MNLCDLQQCTSSIIVSTIRSLVDMLLVVRMISPLGLRCPPLRARDAIGETLSGMRLGREVEFEHTGHHDHGLRPVTVLEHCEFQRFGAIDEEAAAEASLVASDPMALAVAADEEKRGLSGSRRGRFTFFVH